MPGPVSVTLTLKRPLTALALTHLAEENYSITSSAREQGGGYSDADSCGGLQVRSNGRRPDAQGRPRASGEPRTCSVGRQWDSGRETGSPSADCAHREHCP